MKKIEELLQIMLDNIEEVFSNPLNNCDGLCILNTYLARKHIISRDEKRKLVIYLKRNLPILIGGVKYDCFYCWMPGELEPRIKWLTNKIENYEN